ncbi:MAG: hypothetical protein GX612_06720, partial [Bacteroidales bacterium]|nr:hypothetical protein [Bacteroidales bacterium]
MVMITANHTRLSTKPYFGYNIQDVSQYVMKKLVTEKPVHLRELGRKVLNELPPEKKMGLLKNLISDSKTESLISSPKKLKRVDKLAIEYIKGKLKSFDDSSLKIEEGLFS